MSKQTYPFGPYNTTDEGPDAQNYPTWTVKLWFGDRGATDETKEAFYDHYLTWKQSREDDPVLVGILRSWLMNAMNLVWWSKVSDALHGKPLPANTDVLTEIVTEGFQAYNAADPRTIDGDDGLKQYASDMLNMWVERYDLRQRTSSFLSVMAQHIIEVYMDGLQWQYIAALLAQE